MKTTLNAIREHAPCADGWKKLLGNLGKSSADDEPLSLLTILDSNGLDDAIWCLRAATGHDKEIRLFAVWCARKVQHLMTAPVFINAMDVAERFANGLATAEELAAARGAARDAITALIAYDDCAYLLEQTPEVVRASARLTDDPAAVLLLPAVMAMGLCDEQR